jgi:putative ABC transport system substrate-binding protein
MAFPQRAGAEMQRREFIGLICGAAAWPLAARAQQPKKAPRIGVLWQGQSAETHPYYRPLRESFKAVGYAEGDLIFEDRFADKNSGDARYLERLDLLAQQLVGLKCDVLIGFTLAPALALRRATSTAPIVFVFNPNPVGSGLVSSLNHPGGNVTGVAHVSPQSAPKRVELLRDTIPGLSSLALIYDPNPALQFANRPELEDTRAAANQLGLSFETFECGGSEVLEEAISKASKFGAAILGNNNWHVFMPERIADLCIARKLPAIAPADVFPGAGLLMSYGPNWTKLVRSVGRLVKKILEGENPKDIPVEEPTEFDLVFNLKTAQALGLQIPPIVLARATRVIE